MDVDCSELFQQVVDENKYAPAFSFINHTDGLNTNRLSFNENDQEINDVPMTNNEIIGEHGIQFDDDESEENEEEQTYEINGEQEINNENNQENDNIEDNNEEEDNIGVISDENEENQEGPQLLNGNENSTYIVIYENKEDLSFNFPVETKEICNDYISYLEKSLQ